MKEHTHDDSCCHQNHHSHLGLILILIVVLAVGELSLYRKVMVLNKMVSEGFMQVQETVKEKPTVTPSPLLSPNPTTVMKK